MFTDPKYVFTMGNAIFNSYEEEAEHTINLLRDKYKSLYAKDHMFDFFQEIKKYNEVLNEKWKKNKLEIVGVYNISNYSVKLSLEENKL